MASRRKKQEKPAAPGSRPLRKLLRKEIEARFEAALVEGDGVAGAHCIHELWVRNARSTILERLLERLWSAASESVPEWLPKKYIKWLPLAYEVAARFQREGRGRTNIYLVLLEFQDSPSGPYGVYVGMTRYPPAERFEQHKAGIRAAGSVQRRGLEVLSGPVAHLQGLKRAQAKEIEEQLAEALQAEGLLVRGGH